jgi:ADP-ribosyl-[dinitrogen reductase] hydrolase
MATSRVHPSFVQLDRTIGTVFGGAVGDALGAGYEFGPPVDPTSVGMRPGTLSGEPAGHWTDDTAMSVAILESAAKNGTLTSTGAVQDVSRRFLEWYESSPRDIGVHTCEVLALASNGTPMVDAAREIQRRDPGNAGNGSLMRTGPVALAYLGDAESLIHAATTLSALTHSSRDAVEACVLWTLAIDHSIRTGELVGPRDGLDALPEERQAMWNQILDAAENETPSAFTPNGYVVTAMQAAWSSIYVTKGCEDHLSEALRTAVAIGDDTDTVAAIAGSLLGATYGVRAIPSEWRVGLAGWPREYRGVDLVRLALRAVLHGEEDPPGVPDGSLALNYFAALV